MYVDDIIVAKVFLAKQKNAKRRRIEFKLTFKKVKQLLSRKTCYYTGIEMTNSMNVNDILSRTIDRIDSSKGYTDDNVVVCIKDFNSLKSNLDNEHLYKILKAVTKLKERNGKTK